MRQATYHAGQVLRCVAIAASGNACRKPFGLARATIVVREAVLNDNAPLQHRCTACRTVLSVMLPASEAAAA